MKEIQAFHQALADPREAALAATGIPIGYLCSYAPEELIHAAGFHPVRLFPTRPEISLADNHLQVYCCHLLRGILEDGLSGRLEHLHGVVFPHTCDSIQRMSDIWRLNVGHTFFADVAIPTKLNAQSARRYMTLVMARFKSELEKAKGGPIAKQSLLDSISLYNRIRKQLLRMGDLKSTHPHIISGTDMSALVKGCMIMDRQRADELLGRILPQLEEKALALDPTPCKRILVTGSVCDSPDLYEFIEDAGGAVVVDDLCTGQRWFDGLIPEDGDPMEGLAVRYLDRYICPAKHTDILARQERVTDLARTVKADGVIFLRLKFCDPQAFDYPHLAQALDREKIRHLLVEMGDMRESRGQLATRIETFTEMI
ncbi:MAG: 2-hydroxyacyl-CoA dehydratase family protein [Desulfobacterales bacterium]|nr:2-hydroxyacyl-CoA dehydratase family protein [Desulfobacterales bacterium]